MTREHTAHVSAMDLDLHQMGDLSPERSQALLSHLAVCEACRNRQTELASAYGEFSAEVFPRTAPKLRDRKPVAEVVPLYRRPLAWAPALAAAAALLLFVKTGVFTGGSAEQPGEHGADLGVKGNIAFSFDARRNGSVVVTGSNASMLSPGDEVRFVVTSGNEAHRYLLIVSVDGESKVSVYYPFDGTESAKLPHAGRFEVPDSVVLDQASGPERVFAVLSAKPVKMADLRDSLVEIGKGGVDSIRGSEVGVPNADVASVLIEKP